MFRGSIPATIQSIIAENVENWSCPDIYVGCSGNFTVERVLHTLNRFGLHGNDITLYTAIIGAHLAKQPFRIALEAEYAEEYAWLEPYLQTSADAVATVMLATRLTEGLGRTNTYYERMRAAYRAQWPELHAKTVAKINANEVSLKSFFAGGVLEMMDGVPREMGMVCYPPFFAGDYENMFAKIDALFDWDAPSYLELDAEKIDGLFDRITEQQFWMFGVHRRLEKYEPWLKGITQTTNRATPVFIYASHGKPRRTGPHQEITPVTLPRLQPSALLGERLSLAALTYPQFCSLRSQYMNENIRPGQASLPVAVMVDGILVGVFAFSSAPTLANWAGKVAQPNTYLLSDFPVAPTDYRHLAKLVLYAALSHESKLLIERASNKRIRSCVTTAFSKRPVSMKYRGLFDLLSRKEQATQKPKDQHGDTTDTYYSQPFELNYGSDLGRWSLAEGFAQWQKRYGERTATAKGETE